MITIKERDFDSFFKVPFNVYDTESPYVATFRPELKKMLSTDNPIFESEEDYSFFTAFKEHLPVGRITVHIHRNFNKRYASQTAYFGFFECIDDQAIADKLFSHAVQWAESRGCEKLTGNFNLTAMQEMGVVVSGFDKAPYTAQMFGQPYYPKLMKMAGLGETYPMSTYEVDLNALSVARLIGPKQKELIQDDSFRFIPVTRKVYKKYQDEILELFNKGFDENDMFTPFSRSEFDFQANGLLTFMDQHISYMALHRGRPVGISVHVPDINPFIKSTSSRLKWVTPLRFFQHRMKRDRVICIFAAVLKEYQNTGITGLISYHATLAMKQRGYKKFGITWISHSNVKSIKKVINMGGEALHELRIFERPLTQKNASYETV